MWSDFSIPSDPQASPQVDLRIVYMVHADSSYDVQRRQDGVQRCALFRTFDGAGELWGVGIPRIRMEKDTLLLVEFSQVRRYRWTEGLWRFGWIEFNFRGEPPLPLNVLLPMRGTGQDERLIREAIDVLRGGGSAEARCASGILAYLLARWRYESEQNLRIEKQRNYGEALRSLIRAYSEDLRKPRRIRSMAEEVGLSERRFRQVFKDELGMGPKEYFDRLRLDHARELLRTQGASVTDAAYASGFSSPFHLSKAFKDRFGYPPRTERG
jgi:AraC-like DNA-binding protein